MESVKGIFHGYLLIIVPCVMVEDIMVKLLYFTFRAHIK